MQTGRYVKYLGVGTQSLGKKASDINMKSTPYSIVLKENTTYSLEFSSVLWEA